MGFEDVKNIENTDANEDYVGGGGGGGRERARDIRESGEYYAGGVVNPQWGGYGIFLRRLEPMKMLKMVSFK